MMQTIKRPEAIFFDLDGTLIDTAPDMGGALNRMLEKRNRSPLSPETYRADVSHGSMALLKLGFTEFDGKPDQLKLLKPEFLQTYAKGICDGSKLFDGVHELLEGIEKMQIPWGIITNKPEQLTLVLLDALKLRTRCCSIVGADTTTHAKPHPAPMNLACKRAAVNPANCFYLGDAERDIQAGRAVNMKTFVAGWGYIDEQRDNTASWNPDHYLGQPLELLNYL